MRLGVLLTMIRMEHTLFSLPFAYTGAFLAVGVSGLGQVALDHRGHGGEPMEVRWRGTDWLARV